MKAIEEMVSPILDKNKVDIASMVAFHMNLNTDSVNKLYDKLNNITPKAVIGWQSRRKTWPAGYWSSVWVFPDEKIEFPDWGDDWEFRYVYTDV